MNNSFGKTEGVVSAEQQPIWTAGKKRTFNGSSKLRDGQRGSRRLCSVWIGVGEIEEAAGAYAETKIEELAETETSFDLGARPSNDRIGSPTLNVLAIRLNPTTKQWTI
jgi:hypothetical protein